MSEAREITQSEIPKKEKSSPISRVADLLSWTILSGGIVTTCLATYIVVVGHSRLPFWDAWMQIDFAANESPTHTVEWLWRQFNQHRVVLPKLFLLADLRLFHATQISLLALNLAIQLLHLCLLAWSMRVFGGWQGPVWRTGTGLAAFCLFCPSQWPSLVMGFTGLCCYLPSLFATISFISLLQLWQSGKRDEPGRRRWIFLATCVFAALAETYSLSNGNLLWPLLVFGALLLRVPLRAIAALIIVATVGISAFFYNYTVYISTSSLIRSPGGLSNLLRYVAVYFGSSWVQNSIRVAELFGFLGFLLLLLVLSRVPSYFLSCPGFCVQLLLTLLFVLATGLVTAPGRLPLGIQQAFSERYQSFALLFWGCMALILLGGAQSKRLSNLLLLQIVVVAAMVFAGHKAEIPLRSARWQAFNLHVASIALETGAPDTTQLFWVHSDPQYPRLLVPYMRQYQLSIFSDNESRMIGQPLNSVFRMSDVEKCDGRIQTVTTIEHSWPVALRVTGWAWMASIRRPPSEVVFANEGTIVGLGAMGDWRSNQDRTAARANTNFIGFTGYLTGASNANTVDVFGILRDSKAALCHIGSLQSN